MIAKSVKVAFNIDMSTVLEIEDAIARLPRNEQESLREWLENLLEDQMVMKDEFKAEIEAGQRDLAEGRTRSRQG